METTARRIAIIVSYDGTAFSGYQIQNSGRTVQHDLENALSILCRHAIRVTAAGRTDTGVHALHQVVHFNTVSSIPLKRLCIGCNGILSKDISVLNAYQVPDSFHARFSACSREYVYRIYNHPLRSPFMMYRALWHPEKIDIQKFLSILLNLKGEHDFKSFCKLQSSGVNTVRTIEHISVEQEEGDIITITIRGNAFLHNMIRIIIGTVLDMLKNSRTDAAIIDILNKHDRNAAGSTAPPFGLYLNRVEYSPPLSEYPSAFTV